jgi:hypothetical protein
MLAAFDFTVGGDLCDRTAEQAFRLPTLLALPPRVYGAPWITDGYESSFHSAAGTIFSLQAVIPFCVRYSCRFVFLRRNLDVCCQFSCFQCLVTSFTQQYSDIVRMKDFIERKVPKHYLQIVNRL